MAFLEQSNAAFSLANQLIKSIYSGVEIFSYLILLTYRRYSDSKETLKKTS